MAIFTGTLHANEIFGAMFNMIISQEVFANNISSDAYSTLVDRARVDGSLYGDQKLFYATDVLGSVAWGKDAASASLLELDRPSSPDVQAIVLDVFRQIPLTVDNYLSKRAWGSEGAFDSFNSVMLGWIRDTKYIYDLTIYNSFIGTNETNIGKQSITITLPVVAGNPEAQARLRGQFISKELANILSDIKDASRDYNDYGNLRAFKADSLTVVWNQKQHNEIMQIDLPTIFHNDGLYANIEQVDLPDRYFGTINGSGGTTTSDNKTIRSLIEKDYNGDIKRNDPRYDKRKHIFPGDLLPNSTPYGENETYTHDDKILFKIMNKRSVPFMSAFEVGTSFFNPKSLTENHYLTWGHNTLEHLKNFPFITVKGSEPKGK